jgi:hypothetical protein
MKWEMSGNKHSGNWWFEHQAPVNTMRILKGREFLPQVRSIGFLRGALF